MRHGKEQQDRVTRTVEQGIIFFENYRKLDLVRSVHP